MKQFIGTAHSDLKSFVDGVSSLDWSPILDVFNVEGSEASVHIAANKFIVEYGRNIKEACSAYIDMEKCSGIGSKLGVPQGIVEKLETLLPRITTDRFERKSPQRFPLVLLSSRSPDKSEAFPRQKFNHFTTAKPAATATTTTRTTARSRHIRGDNNWAKTFNSLFTLCCVFV